jgi:predicted nucleic acid-binding protein
VNPIFADTFYWIALLNRDDPDHDRVTAFDLSLHRPPLVTTLEVLTEFLTYFSGRGSLFRKKAAAIAHALEDDPDVRLLRQTSESFSAGLRLYTERPDKEYSLTDCISIATMRAEGMTESATGDRHFEQEGFRALFSVGPSAGKTY